MSETAMTPAERSAYMDSLVPPDQMHRPTADAHGQWLLRTGLLTKEVETLLLSINWSHLRCNDDPGFVWHFLLKDAERWGLDLIALLSDGYHEASLAAVREYNATIEEFRAERDVTFDAADLNRPPRA
jgi:hypothetical protein